MQSLYKEARISGTDAVAGEGRWMIGVNGIVAENQDPEKQHRVKLIIPSIDENLIFDEWARSFAFCLGNGYGTALIPPKGAEVILFGQLGQKFNLFYVPVYNEEMLTPDGFENEMSVGVSAPGDLKFLAELLARIHASNVELLAEQVAKITATSVEIDGSDSVEIGSGKLNVNGTQISVQSDGTIDISGGNINVNASGTLKLQNRTVNKGGPSI